MSNHYTVSPETNITNTVYQLYLKNKRQWKKILMETFLKLKRGDLASDQLIYPTQGNTTC